MTGQDVCMTVSAIKQDQRLFLLESGICNFSDTQLYNTAILVVVEIKFPFQRESVKLFPKCHFVTYYSHFRVLGNLANISVLNRGKTPKKNANFDF